MGREIRRVPGDWEHPLRKCEHEPWKGGCSQSRKHGGQCFHPLHDKSFADAAAEWKADFLKWEHGERPHFEPSEYPSDYQFWEWNGGPPDREYYRERKWTAEEATYYQLYETVSEGTPLSPAFATKEELVRYLTQHGDFWDEKPWAEAAARRMVESEYTPSLIVMKTEQGTTIQEPRDMV